ncbi:hypothetical protein F5146DRAFT_996240 [Armillaria mellea]|nr:hypothetical protein F5146DRAFT_996240 [Armillaria mellea]
MLVFPLSIFLLFGLNVAAGVPSPMQARSGTHLTQAEAEALLIPAGITAYSSGGCTDNILSETVNGVITLKKASGSSSLVITGGTETGHASGTYSHANGYKGCSFQVAPNIQTTI